jgi:hypothetical protein
MITKDFSEVIDYSELLGINEQVSIKDEKFFKEYKERLETHPLTEVKIFNWKDPVVVSLVETESKKLLNKNAVATAVDLWKRDEFRNEFNEAANGLIEDVEEGTEMFKSLFENYPQVFFLDAADRKALFGKTILASKELKENMNILLKGLDLLFEKFDLSEMKEDYLREVKEGEEDMEMEAPELPKEKALKEPEEPKEKEPAKELSKEDLQKIADELKKIAEKVEQEELKTKLEELITKLEKGKEEGTKPEDVKEAISILSL